MFPKTGVFLEHLAAYLSLPIILIINQSGLIKNSLLDFFLPKYSNFDSFFQFYIKDFIKLRQTVKFHGILSICSRFTTNLVIFCVSEITISFLIKIFLLKNTKQAKLAGKICLFTSHLRVSTIQQI